MNALFNSKVKKVKWVARPLQGVPDWLNKLSMIPQHQGIVVILEDGSEYLIHIVPGQSGCITDAKHMSSKWNCNLKSSDCNVKEKNTNVTVGKLMGAAQQAGIYSVTTNNCYHMAGRVWISS